MHISEACSLFLCWLQASGGWFWKNSQWPRAPGSPYVMCLCTLCNFHILWQPSDRRDIRRADSSSFPALTTWLLRRYSEEKKNLPTTPDLPWLHTLMALHWLTAETEEFLLFWYFHLYPLQIEPTLENHKLCFLTGINAKKQDTLLFRKFYSSFLE